MFVKSGPNKYTAGYSLVALLVTTIVFSVGMLGFGVLQLESLKKSNESHLKSIASIQAADIIDRMKANPDAIASDFFVDTSQNLGKNHLSCLGGVKDAAYDTWETGEVTLPVLDNEAANIFIGLTLIASSGGSTGGSNNGVSTSCNAQEMAETDLYQWKENLSSVLPSGNGNICKTNDISSTNCNALGDIYVITISWSNKDGTTQQYRVGFTP